MDLQNNNPEDAESPRYSFRMVRELGKKSLLGLAFGTGMMIPVIAGGVWYAGHVKSEADSLMEDKLQKAGDTGHNWSITFSKEFSKENTQKVVPSLDGVQCAIAQRLPRAPQTTQNSTSTTIKEVCPEVSDMPTQNAEGATTTVPVLDQEVVTTLPPDPEADAAP